MHTGPISDIFGRYIDDCLGTAISTRVDLERFINYVNGFHPALKFTLEISETCMSFFDISVSIKVAPYGFLKSEKNANFNLNNCPWIFRKRVKTCITFKASSIVNR